MGCMQKSLDLEHTEESYWRKNLGTEKKAVHEIRKSLRSISNTGSFTKDEFNLIEKSIKVLDSITGNKWGD